MVIDEECAVTGHDLVMRSRVGVPMSQARAPHHRACPTLELAHDSPEPA